MEEITQALKESLKDLPSHIREVIIHTPWQEKVDELALKYSLTEEQKSALFTEVLLVLTATTSEENLLENIKNEVGVSNILAEQLTEEIGDRIFSWVQKIYTEKEKMASESTFLENTLDIPPPNLPSEDLAEEAPVLWTKQEPLAQLQETTHTILEEQVTPPTPPQHQETYSFKADITPKPEPDTVITPPTPRTSFIENKLSQPVKPASPVAPPQSYVSDPYREPLE